MIVCANSGKLCIFVQCANVKKIKSHLELVTYKYAHLPDHSESK